MTAPFRARDMLSCKIRVGEAQSSGEDCYCTFLRGVRGTGKPEEQIICGDEGEETAVRVPFFMATRPN
jgi:hypothetical protein